MGDASAWAATVRTKLGTTRVNGIPAIGSIAWWSGRHSVFGFNGAGHVAYVERVGANGLLYLSDSRWSSGSSRWRVVRGDRKYPEAFLHVRDAPRSAGLDSIGQYFPWDNSMHLRNALNSGPSDYIFRSGGLGPNGEHSIAIVGDWNGT